MNLYDLLVIGLFFCSDRPSWMEISIDSNSVQLDTRQQGILSDNWGAS